MQKNSPIAAGPVVYVALGDSTGSGVGATHGGYVARLFNRLQPIRPGSTLVNLCVSGATSADVLHNQVEAGVANHPQLVTLGIGINDIGHGFTLDQFARNYDMILDTLRRETTAAIVVTNLPDISSAPSLPAAIRGKYQRTIIQFNQRLEDKAKRHGAAIFDVYTITHEGLPGHPECFSGDGFHPSDLGYELWAEKMWPTVAITLGE